MADTVQDLLLRFRGEAGDVKHDIDDVILHLRALAAEDATTEVEAKGIDKTIAGLEKVRLAMAFIPDKKTVKVQAKTDTNSFKAVQGIAENLKTLVEGFDDADRSSRGFRRSLAVFGTEAIQVFSGTTNASIESVAALSSLAIVIGILIAALAALASSAALALGGLGALAVALGGVLLPAGILAVGVFSSFSKVLEALKAKEQGAQQDAIKSAQGHSAAAAAADQRRQAEQNLTDALQRVTEARVQAYREEQDAAEKVKDSLRDLAHARLDRVSAALGLQQAKLELADFRKSLGLTADDIAKLFDEFKDVEFDPSKLSGALSKFVPGSGKEDQLKLAQLILNVKEARLHEKDAVDGVHDSTVNLNRAQEDNNKFLRDGIKASQGYAAALKAVRDAREQLARVNDNAVSSGFAKAEVLTNKLTKAQQRLLTAIENVKKAFKNSFKGATDAILNAISAGLEKVPALLAGVAGPFTKLGKSIGKGLGSFIKVITSFESLAAFQKFTDAAAGLAGPIGKLMGQFLLILLRIGTAALPGLLKVLRAVFKYFDRLFGKTADPKKLQKVINLLVDNFLVWAGVFGKFGNLFLAFITAAGPAGKELAKWIGDVAQHMADWLNSKQGRKEVQDFFNRTIPFVKSLAGFLVRVVRFFLRLGEIFAPILKPVLDTINTLLDVLDKVMKPLTNIVHFFKTTLRDAIVYTFLGPVGFVFLVIKAINSVKKHFSDWVDKIKSVGKKIGGAIAGGFKTAFDAIWSFVKDRLRDVLSVVNHLPGVDIRIAGINDKRSSRTVKDIASGGRIGPIKFPDIRPVHPSFHDSGVAGTASLRAAAASAGGVTIEHQDVILPQPASGDGIFDPKHGAVEFAEEMRRRGWF